jgi:hypothetical protein
MARKTRKVARRVRKTRRVRRQRGSGGLFSNPLQWWKNRKERKEREESERRIKAYCQKKKEYSSCMQFGKQSEEECNPTLEEFGLSNTPNCESS